MDNRGLYGKFRVTTVDGSDVAERIFVLRPERDPHAAAMAAAFPDVITRFRGRYAVRKWVEDSVSSNPIIACPECTDAVALDVGDAHVRVVLSAYAAAVESDNPVLAADLRAMVGT